MGQIYLILWDIDYTLISSGGVDDQVWLDVCSTLSGRAVESIKLVPLAQERASRILGTSPERTETVLVGDSLLDVDAGRRSGRERPLL